MRDRDPASLHPGMGLDRLVVEFLAGWDTTPEGERYPEVQPALFETRRSWADQVAAVEAGTSRAHPDRTFAYHVAGLAVDVVPQLRGAWSWNMADAGVKACFQAWARYAQNRGFVAAGLAWRWDWPHVEVAPVERAKEAQRLLQDAGLYRNGAVDGQLGPKSKAALAEFAKRVGLPPEGRLTTRLWLALEGREV